MTGSSGLTSDSRSYAYDLDGNRLTETVNGSTKTSTYDRTDQLVNVAGGGSPTAYAYDRYGNLTSNAESVSAVTAMTYDLGDKLTAIDATGTANDATFTFDAFGRFRTRILSGSTDTYSYAGASETVLRIANSAGTTTDSIVSPAGDRLGIKQGATLNWLLPDLHGNVAAAQDATETTTVNAIRYDPYGRSLATGSGGGTAVGQNNWKFQGRLDVSPTGLSTPLYDMSARFYSPGIGAFTQLDSVMGGAQNPLSMNRFLYALANPATMVDPSGHFACPFGPDCNLIDYDPPPGMTDGNTPSGTNSTSTNSTPPRPAATPSSPPEKSTPPRGTVRFGLYNPEVYMDYWATTRQMKNDCEMWANSQLSHDVICGAYAARVEARLNERACGADPFICLAKLGLLVFAGAGMVTAAGAAPAAIGTVSCAGACLTAANGIAHGAILGGAAGFFGYLGGGVAGNMAGGRDPREGLNVRDMLMAMAQGALAGGVVGGIAPLGLSLPGMKTAPALSGAAWAMGLFAGSISATRSWLSRGSRVSRSARRTQFQ